MTFTASEPALLIGSISNTRLSRLVLAVATLVITSAAHAQSDPVRVTVERFYPPDDRYPNCGYISDPHEPPRPDPNWWCKATWVQTRNVNLSPFQVIVATQCVAYDRNGRILGQGSDDAGEAPVPEYGRYLEGSSSSSAQVRIPNVEYQAVAKVECTVTTSRPVMFD